MQDYTIDVIIPTYKPGSELLCTIDMLNKQTVKPNKIIIVDSLPDSKAGTEGIKTAETLLTDRLSEYEVPVMIYNIDKGQFDHGGTRNQGVEHSDSHVFICMTQDAIPANDVFIEALISPLADKQVAVSYARQLAKEDSSIEEQVARAFNYPDASCIKDASDLGRLGIKTYFCSNVSCAYNAEIFANLGGFIDKTIFNEDMIYAAKAVKAGYKISYMAKAMVYHSHNYTPRQQFRRNVDIGVSQAQHPEVFDGLSSESEGKKLVMMTMKRLVSEGRILRIPGFIWMIVNRYAGFLIGKHYKRFPISFIKKVSMNPGYFG